MGKSAWKDKTLESQSTIFKRIRKQIDDLAGVSKDELTDLLKINGCHVGKKVAQDRKKCLEILVDLIIFGSLPACQRCGDYRLRWNDDANLYRCVAYKTGGQFCDKTETKPRRGTFKLTVSLKKHEVLSKYKGRMMVRKQRVFSDENEARNFVFVTRREYASSQSTQNSQSQGYASQQRQDDYLSQQRSQSRSQSQRL